MAERVQKQKTAQKSETEQVEDLPGRNEEAEKLKAELDELLEDLEDVLETNAEEFLEGFVQKGGQ